MPVAAPFPWQQKLWDNVIGQLAAGRLPHAMLLAGAPGLGKFVFAQALAQSLLCESRLSNGKACGQCRGCHLFSSGNHPDFLQIQPEEEGKEIGIAKVRELAAFQTLKSQSSPFKVIIVRPADRLTANAANAILKTLEEPTPGTALLLVADRAQSLLPTIRSRCQTLLFRADEHRGVMRDWLGEHLDHGSSADLLLQLTAGAPLRALELAKSGGLEQRQQIFEAFASIAEGSADPLKVAAGWTEMADGIFASIYEWIADLIRLKSGAGSASLSSPDLAKHLQAMGERLDLRTLYRSLDRAQESRRLARGAANRQLLLEEFLIGWGQLSQENRNPRQNG